MDPCRYAFSILTNELAIKILKVEYYSQIVVVDLTVRL